jgi:hypothetical protein
MANYKKLLICLKGTYPSSVEHMSPICSALRASQVGTPGFVNVRISDFP